MEKQIEVFALIGPAGCGKDTVLKGVIDRMEESNLPYNQIISYTSRPPREGEINGVEYLFTTPGYFLDLFETNEIVEAVTYNDWIYGTSVESYDAKKINIGIFSPERLDILLADSRFNVTIFFISVSNNIRLIRQLSREQNPDVDEILRRYSTDNNDFHDIITDYPQMIVVKNEDLEDLPFAINRIYKECIRKKKLVESE